MNCGSIIERSFVLLCSTLRMGFGLFLALTSVTELNPLAVALDGEGKIKRKTINRSSLVLNLKD